MFGWLSWAAVSASRADVAVECNVRRQDLDGDGSVQAEIGRAIHHSHPATTDLVLDQVLGADRDGDAVAQIVIHA